jgi:uncharacterized membrane protein YfcA
MGMMLRGVLFKIVGLYFRDRGARVSGFLVLLALGALAGGVAGLFGVGGGLVIVPVLLLFFAWQGFDPAWMTHLAIGTSLTTIVATSVSSTWSHHLRNGVDWDWVRGLTLGILAGAWMGGLAADRLSGPGLQLLFAGFVLLVSLHMFLGGQPATGRVPSGPLVRVAGGGVIGLVSALFGIGGGTLSVPFLTLNGLVMQRAVGTSAACGLAIAVAGSLSYIFHGLDAQGLPAGSTGYVYWPAVLGIVLTSVPMARVGARMAHGLDARILKKLFAGFLLLVGLKLMSGALS